MYPVYPEHPFINDVNDLSVEQLLEKIDELNKKLRLVYQTSNPNVYVINQMMMALETYQTKYREKLRKPEKDDGFKDIIDVS